MRVRSRFVLLFAIQALVAALASVVFAFGAMAAEGARAEAEVGAPSTRPSTITARVLDPRLSEGARLAAALDYIETLQARLAAARVYRSQAAIEAAVSIGGFSLAWAGFGALAFALASRGFTRRLDELVAGAIKVTASRSFRLPLGSDREFAPVFGAFNEMLDRLALQEALLAEAAKLEGWKEVSSFLFHQLRTPLSTIELASRNVLAASMAATAAMASTADTAPTAARANPAPPVAGPDRDRAGLKACAASAETALAETTRIRVLLDRFRSLSGLSLAPATAIPPSELTRALASRIAPHRALLTFAGTDEPVFVDRRLTEEALLNLVVNAAEACPSPPASVRLEVLREGGFALLEISDANGPVDPGIFERSGRERYSTKPEGTGLGLLFVRRVAALHGGSFAILPGEDGGFRVRLGLPLAGPGSAGTTGFEGLGGGP